MSMDALNSSERMDWCTPPWFLRLVQAIDVIAYDPATCASNPTGALEFEVQGDRVCGLRTDWQERSRGGLVFCNPPYGAHLSGPIEPRYEHWKIDPQTKQKRLAGIGRGWAQKIASEDAEIVSLVPVRSETDWWRAMFFASDALCLWSSRTYGSRIRFVDPETGAEGGQPNLASTVFYKGPRRDVFEAVFGEHGLVIRGGRGNAFRVAA